MEPTVDAAFSRIYNFDFASGRELAQRYAQLHPRDPMGPATVAASHLFSEMNRLNLLAGAPDQKPGKPDPRERAALENAWKEARQRAEAALARDPNDANSLTALMLVRGMERDYLALVEKSYRSSWVSAREAQALALRLVEAAPQSQDAWFTIGFSDYLISTVPGIFRPFMKMEQADGNKQRGIANLEKAAQAGRYLKGFARLMLASIYKKERRPRESERLLRELAQEYPDNPVLRREVGRLDGQTGGSE
jgi:hypothetical protein